MGKYTLPDLPYAYDALEPYIDAETMKIHHGKHHQTYVDKLNAAMEGESLSDKPVDELLEDFPNLPDRLQKPVRNHGGGHANHTLFWQIMGGENMGGQPGGSLGSAIDDQFGSFKQFQEIFTTTGLNHFGSGWVWMVIAAGERKRKDQKKLLVLSLPNQDSPLMGGHTPILGLDLWEHAYYLSYQNKRPAYIEAFWNVVNWDEVGKRFGEVDTVAVQPGMFKGKVLER